MSFHTFHMTFHTLNMTFHTFNMTFHTFNMTFNTCNKSFHSFNMFHMYHYMLCFKHRVTWQHVTIQYMYFSTIYFQFSNMLHWNTSIYNISTCRTTCFSRSMLDYKMLQIYPGGIRYTTYFYEPQYGNLLLFFKRFQM